METPMADWLTDVWREIAARPDGPFALRFFLQPCMATFFAIRDGLKDARTGRDPYFWALFVHSQHRKQLLQDGWRSAGKIFVIAAVLDVIYQFVVLHGHRPIQTVFIATLLAIVPYIMFRGPINRIATMIRHHSPHRLH